MWRNTETGEVFKTKIGALWSAHVNQIKDFYKSDNMRFMAYFGSLMTPVVLDTYGCKLEKV